jgi:hypothetical protein
LERGVGLSEAFSTIILLLLLIGAFTLALKIQPVRADGTTIYINSDGSITPSAAPISTLDNVTYTFTDNITNANGIVIERDNILMEGAGYTLQ